MTNLSLVFTQGSVGRRKTSAQGRRRKHSEERDVRMRRGKRMQEEQRREDQRTMVKEANEENTYVKRKEKER